MRYLKCKCGEHEMWTTDSPKDCQGCEKCGTTFAGFPDNYKPLQPHRWVVNFDQNTGKPYKRCGDCYEVDEETYNLARQQEPPMTAEDVDKYYKNKIHNIEPETHSDDNPSEEKSLDDTIPKNLEEAINFLTTNENKEYARDKTEEKFLGCLHFSTGMGLRNGWGLWTGSVLSRWFNEHGIYHADDMSSIILTSVYRVFNNKEIDLEGQIKSYRDYWDKVDPKVNEGKI